MAGSAGVAVSSESWLPLINHKYVTVRKESCSKSEACSQPANSAESMKALNALKHCIRSHHIAEATMRKALAEADLDKTGILTLSAFSNAARKVGLVIRKFWMRPLKKSGLIFHHELVRVNDLLETLVQHDCWPDHASLASFGNRSCHDADDVEEEVSDISEKVSDLDEHHSFDEIAAQSPCRVEIKSEFGLLIQKSRYSNQSRQTSSPYQLTANRAVADWLLPKLGTTLGIQKDGSRPGENCHARSGKPVSSTRSNCSTKVESTTPDKCAYSVGISRGRALEYAAKLEAKDAPMRKSLEYTTRFWKRSPFPANAIEYRKWHLLKRIMPGFSSPEQVVMRQPSAEWQSPKTGVGDGRERTEKSSLQGYDLKMQRNEAKRILEADHQLKAVRRLVIRGEYDQALESAVHAFELYRDKNVFATSSLSPAEQPVSFVRETMKREINKLLKSANSQLERRNFQKAQAHIPVLSKACNWLAIHASCSVQKSQGEDKALLSCMDQIEDLVERILRAEQSHALEIEMSSLNSYFATIRNEFDARPPSLADDSIFEKKNKLPLLLIADGRSYLAAFDVKPPDLPDHLDIGTKLIVRGAAILGSGKKDDGRKARHGTVTNFNERSSKYKIQYVDDHEWILWPPQLQIEIDIDPEEAVFEMPGFDVRSKSIDRNQYHQGQENVLVVEFSVTPQGPPFDFCHFGEVDATVKGLKSGKSLLDTSQICQVHILPPTFMLPPKTYCVFDAVSMAELNDGVVEFVNREDSSVSRFEHGEEILNLRRGVYTVQYRNKGTLEEPALTSYHRTAIVVEGSMERHPHEMSKIFLNRTISRPDQLRIVLSWNSQPQELDMHIYTSSGFHGNHETLSTCLDGTLVHSPVIFEMDTSAGYGPETATILLTRSLYYSCSICIPEIEQKCSWAESSAVVSLFDSTGLIAMFHLPHEKCCENMQWWHVFALDGSRWDHEDHGILRINQLSSEETPQFSTPGWKMLESAKHRRWDDFCKYLTDMVHEKTSKDLQMIPHDLANVATREGETVLGLICSHNEADSTAHCENDVTPLQKQLRSLELYLRESGRRAISGESLMSGGLPASDTLQRECQFRGPTKTFIYHAVVDASMDVAVFLLNHVAAFVKRCTPVHGYRRFFEKFGDLLLLACIEERKGPYLLPVLRALLANEAVWIRRAQRRFRKGDPVLIENPPSSGDWFEGVVEEADKVQGYPRAQRSFTVRFFSRHQKARDVCLQGNTVVEGGNVVVSNASAGNLRWRSLAVEKARIYYRRYQDQVQVLSSYKYQRERSTLKIELTELNKLEALYKEALSLLMEKAYL